MQKKRITYRFGRSAFRDFETGNTKEWLLSNGIGGYANSTIHGNSSRIFSAYLIASLHPPVDRVLVLAKTHEELIFTAKDAGRERLFSMRNVPPEASTEGISVVRKDLATQQYPGYVREGYRYQTDFSFDFWPEYGYFVDGISVRKRIALAYGKNETAIHYGLVNHGREKATFSVTPLFNFRPFGAVSEKKELDFKVECRDGELLLTTKAAEKYRIRFAASEGEFYDRAKRPTSMATPDYVMEENQLYCVDGSNGFTGVDNHFTPYELHVAIEPGERKELGLICEVFAAGEVGTEIRQMLQEGKTSCVLGNAEEKGSCVVKKVEGKASCTVEKGDMEEKGSCTANKAGAEDSRVARETETNAFYVVRKSEAASPYDVAVLTHVQQIFEAARARGEELLKRANAADALTGRLVLSADHFLVQRESTGLKTVLAGYPWFADWGRDTMIAFTGLTLSTGRFDEAREVLLSFAKYVSQGMLPNVFPNNAAEEPMYNTIDASLWYFYAVYKYLQYTTGLSCYQEAWKDSGWKNESWKSRENVDGAQEIGGARNEEEIFVRDAIYPVLCEIFESYRDGKARYGIHMDGDGLIMGGGGLDQLTWMDVRVGNIVVTPRHGKAVEINALWYNAICCMKLFGERFFGGEERKDREEKEGQIGQDRQDEKEGWIGQDRQDEKKGWIGQDRQDEKERQIEQGEKVEKERQIEQEEHKKWGEQEKEQEACREQKDQGRKAAEDSMRPEALSQLAERVRHSFREKFWNKEKGYLYDTVDENGNGDATLRPNQIFAVSLPFTMLDEKQEQSIVRTVYEKLYTPYGLRSLAQEEQGYRGEYSGRLIGRDLAYHMGTAWGYLSGAFFDAWAKTMCDKAHNRTLLREMLECFADHMADGCLGGIAEIFDGDFACGSRGCYTQAWSVAEVLRAWREVGEYLK